MRFNSVCVLLLFAALASACAKPATTAESTASSSPAATSAQRQPGKVEQELERRLKNICADAQGTVGLSVVHIESGKTISINGNSHRNLLIGFMQRATTGLHRLRGDLPKGTIVADKTGSGEKDATTQTAKTTKRRRHRHSAFGPRSSGDCSFAEWIEVARCSSGKADR